MSEEDLALRLPEECYAALRAGCIERHERQGERASAVRRNLAAIAAGASTHADKGSSKYVPHIHAELLTDRTGGYLGGQVGGESASARGPAPGSEGAGPWGDAAAMTPGRDARPKAARKAVVPINIDRFSVPGQLEDPSLLAADFLQHGAEAAIAHMEKQVRFYGSGPFPLV